MPGEAEDLIEEIEQEVPEEVAEAPEEEAPVAAEEETAPEEAPEEPDPIAARLAAIEEQNRTLQMENMYLKGAQSAKPAPTPAPIEEEEDDEAIAEALRTDPVKTLRAREAKIAERITRQVEERLSGTKQEIEQADADTKTLLSMYPEIQTNQQFNNLAGQVFQQLSAGVGYKPGLKTAAAAIAYGQLVRSGVLMPPSSAPQKVSPVREVTAKKPPVAMVKSAPASGAGGKGDPLAGFSESDKKSIATACRNLGITQEQWLKNYKEAKAEGAIE